MADHTVMFVTLLAFWCIAGMFSMAFGTELLIETLPEDASFIERFGQLITGIPVIGPLLGIITFQYPDVPALFSFLLIMISTLSLYVGYRLVRG